MSDAASALALVNAVIAECVAAGFPADKWKAVAAKLDIPTEVVEPSLFRIPLGSLTMCTPQVFDFIAEYDRYQLAFQVSDAPFTVKARYGARTNGARYQPHHPRYRIGLMTWEDFLAAWAGNGGVVPYNTLTVSSDVYVCKGTEKTTDLQWTVSWGGISASNLYIGCFLAYDANDVLVPNLDGPLPFLVDRVTQPQKWVGYWLQSYDWSHGATAHYIGATPIEHIESREFPMRDRALAPWTTLGRLPSRDDLYLSTMLPARGGSVHIPTYITSTGRVTLASDQNYSWSRLRSPYPDMPMLPGKRGVAMGCYGFGLKAGRDGGAYDFQGQGSCWTHTKRDGTRIPLAGWIDKRPIYYGDISGANLKKPNPYRIQLGDYAGGIGQPIIPNDAGRRQLNRVWGWCWEPLTTARGVGTPIFDGEPSHAGLVRAYIGDMYGKGRVLAADIDGQDPNRGKLDPVTNWPLGKQPSFYEMIPPGAVIDPWFVEKHPIDGLLYVGERKAHRISRWRLPTPGTFGLATFVDYLIQNLNGANYVTFADASLTASQWDIPYDEFPIRRQSGQAGLDACRAQPILAPEDGCIGPDGRVYWSSGSQMDVRSVMPGVVDVDGNLVITRHCEWAHSITQITNKFRALRFDIDFAGATLPGAIAMVAFDNNSPSFTKPRIMLPVPSADGSLTHSQPWYTPCLDFDPIESGRMTSGTAGGVYTLDVAFAERSDPQLGFLMWTDVCGLFRISLAEPTDPRPDAALMQRAHNKFTNGYRMVHGQGWQSMLAVDMTITDADLIAARDYQRANA